MERKKASVFPQELLNLFDEYVHGRMSRRDFLDGAQKFAVGGLTAARSWRCSGRSAISSVAPTMLTMCKLGVDATSAFGTKLT
jgi:hypothetical protein